MFLKKPLSIALLINLLWSTNSFGATAFVVTINKTGEDYNTPALAEDALDLAGSLTDGTVKVGAWDTQLVGNIADGTAVTWDLAASSGTLIHMTNANGGSAGDQFLIDVAAGTLDDNDLVTDGVNSFMVNGSVDSAIIEIDIYDDEGVLDGGVTVDGFVGNTTNYVHITAPVGERHTGIKGTGARFENSAAANVCTLSDVGTRFTWLGARGLSNNTSNANVITLNANNVTVSNCVFYDSFNSGTGTTVMVNTGNFDELVIYNCIIDDPEANGIAINGGTAGNDYRVYNNTIYGCVDGVAYTNVGGNTVVINNLSMNNSSEDYEAGGYDTFLTNGSEDATGTSYPLVPADEWTNTGAGTEDFHLLSTADSIDTGTDNGTGIFSFDIDNYDRDAGGGVWDLGADEFVAAAGNASTQYFFHNSLSDF